MTDQRAINEKEHFDKLAQETGEIWWGSTTPAGLLRKERRADLILKALEPFNNPLVLELGCGTGALTKFLLQKSPDMRLVGLDISPVSVQEAIKRFQSYNHAEFQVANAYKLPFHDNCADAVVGASVIHHFEVEKSLQECFRVVKPGGIIWFSEPNMMNPQVAVEKNIHVIGGWLDNSEDETAFFRWVIAKKLRDVGFVDVKVTPYDFLHPAIPKPLVSFANGFGRLLESLPLFREISGSLTIYARKPESS